MRIISGKYRGKKLIAPQDLAVRPTTDRAKESVFNILTSKLGADWSNFAVLDVFAGSGAFGLEAVSRGALKAVFIDLCPTLLVKNLKLFANEQNKFETLKCNATALPATKEQFDIVFLDAPYNKNLTAPALQILLQNNWLKPNAVIVAEVEKNEQLTLPASLQQFDSRIYASSKFIFCQV